MLNQPQVRSKGMERKHHAAANKVFEAVVQTPLTAYVSPREAPVIVCAVIFV